jgi:membrane protease YdiL (CAAX protease family)
MHSVDAPQPPITPKAHQSGGFWWTLCWFALAVLAFVASLAPFVVFDEVGGDRSGTPIDAAAWRFAEQVVSVAAVLLVLMIGARRAGWSLRGDLGLVWPHWRYLALGFVLTCAHVILDFGLDYILPSPERDSQLFKEFSDARDYPFALVLFWVSIIVITPVWEEIVYRGFILRGWSASPLGVTGAIVLSSAFFAVGHLQFDPHAMILFFVCGCLLALMRWLSGSIVPSILIHAGWSLIVIILLTLEI